jgi:hypothetical protein
MPRQVTKEQFEAMTQDERRALIQEQINAPSEKYGDGSSGEGARAIAAAVDTLRLEPAIDLDDEEEDDEIEDEEEDDEIDDDISDEDGEDE